MHPSLERLLTACEREGLLARLSGLEGMVTMPLACGSGPGLGGGRGAGLCLGLECGCTAHRVLSPVILLPSFIRWLCWLATPEDGVLIIVAQELVECSPALAEASVHTSLSSLALLVKSTA